MARNGSRASTSRWTRSRQRRHQRAQARLYLRGQPERSAPVGGDRPEVRLRSEDRHGARRFLQSGLDGGLADLPAGRPGAVRLHQLASGLHQGRRLHVEHLGQPGGRAAAAGRLCGEAARPEEARGAAPQHRLGPHQQGHFVNAAKEYGAEVVVTEGYIARREGFPFDPGARARRQSGRADADLLLLRRRA